MEQHLCSWSLYQWSAKYSTTGYSSPCSHTLQFFGQNPSFPSFQSAELTSVYKGFERLTSNILYEKIIIHQSTPRSSSQVQEITKGRTGRTTSTTETRSETLARVNRNARGRFKLHKPWGGAKPRTSRRPRTRILKRSRAPGGPPTHPIE